MSTDSIKTDTGIPLFILEIQYLLLETIPLETIMRVLIFLKWTPKLKLKLFELLVVEDPTAAITYE